ncbi:MAG: acetyl-CoA hydrolase/transferase C-terminal domain-containing protein [Bacillota bacterium]|nr:acetyl-CoA hydrolase/transferase C-terminal domain-containing protein [Bacillota bacterium]
MKSFWEEYKRKLVTADEAVKVVQSGDWVDYGDYVTTNEELDAALARRKDELKSVKVRGCTQLTQPAVVQVDPEQEHFVFHDWSFTVVTRKLGAEGKAFLIPENFDEIPKMYYERIRTDVAFITVTPMDEHGYFNMTATAGKEIAEKQMAKHIVLYVNKNVPYCYGGGCDNAVHISEAEYIVESTTNKPLMEIPKPPVTDVDRKIASYIMEEMVDGACLQLGIGGLPNTVGKLLVDSDIKDLGAHSEMMVDAYAELYYAGKLTNKRKNVLPGKSVYTFAMGSKMLYEYLDHNPTCAVMPVDFVNDPKIIAQNDNVFSICGCLSVDIMGQVSSESIGWRQISGTGGQLDFHYASFKSNGGKGFLCMPSTKKKKDGTIESRIVPSFIPGTIVTVPSCITNYVVTEYGMVNLKGLTTWQRAEAIVSIAHPDFQDDLIKACEQAHIWLPSNKR